MNLRRLIKGLVFLATLAGVFYLLKASNIVDGFNKEWIDAAVKGEGINGELLFICMVALVTAIGVPRQIGAFLGGYAYGFVLGTVLAVAGTALSCLITFYYARFMGRSFIQRKFERRIKRVDDFLADNPLSMAVLIRLLPAGNNLVTNMAAGVSSVKALPFVLGSAIGYIPQTAIFALSGDGIEDSAEIRVLVSAALFVASALIGVYLYRRFRNGKTLGRQVDTELGAELGTDQDQPKS